MLNCFTSKRTGRIIPITILTENQFSSWLENQPQSTKTWLSNVSFDTKNFRAELGNICLIPKATGEIAEALCGIKNTNNFWDAGHLPFTLPEGVYQFNINDPEEYARLAIVWGLGAYQFNRYKKAQRKPATLYVPDELTANVSNLVESIYLVRDLINIPTDDLGPTQFALEAEKLAKQYDATFKQIIGEDLLQQNYASIYTVGRASDDAPRLLDIRWGNPSHPKITLVGKGVCFDSGGLDIKPAQYMMLMKKDMGGGAHVLGLGRMLMQAQVPISLRILIPLVENVISGNAYRPGDIIKSRKGLTIEVGNTDAEGRLVLADALTEAASEKPNLIVDIATLTGAARVAVGPELPAVFSNNDAVVDEVIKHGLQQSDPVWRLPLFPLYREYINSSIADINNNSLEPYAGAITAGLFLKEFVPDEIPWLHFDLMGWNVRSRPGRPMGGEAFALRALFNYITTKYPH